MPWDGADEVTFECEPGTLQRHKLETLRELGVTRLSLGVENFDPKILEFNGRAHLEEEIHRAYGWAKELRFDQINIDLIAGMVGETWDNWKQCVAKTLALRPDSVTVYQMELPFNTVFSQQLKVIGQDEPPAYAIADWPTKRDWVDYAFDEMTKAGYEVSSAYTVVKSRQSRGSDPFSDCRFVYRDSLWQGADMFGTGVASFGHAHGVHVQNVDRWEDYIAALDRGELPLGRALPVTPRQLLIREMILQLKRGRLDAGYFRRKFDEDVLELFDDAFAELEAAGHLTRTADGVTLTRQGLLQVDRLLSAFFEPDYRNTRYT
jgi:oxygen-independent coproporphyrinogen-3 oxidase